MIEKLAFACIALAACGPSVTASWTSSSERVPGACAKRTDPFDDGTGEVLLVELVVPGHSKTPLQVPCAQDGFSMDIPDGATEIELTIGLYPGDWATAGASILPDSEPRWERSFTETVTADGDIDLGTLVFAD